MCISYSNNYVRLFNRIGFLSVLLLSLVACKADNTQGVYYLDLNICNERYAHSEQYLVPISFRNGILCVYPDYHTESQIRTPLGLADAFLLVDRLGLRLPTPEVVDSIYSQADIRLAPIPMPPTDEMTSRAYFVRSDSLIDAQLQQAGYEIGPGIRESTQAKLIAGHKKDVVYIDRNSSRVAIYGWHRLTGEPIQPYSTVHHDEYYDYSHGVRPVSPEVFKNGEWMIWSDR
jgi:hypothetical protein